MTQGRVMARKNRTGLSLEDEFNNELWEKYSGKLELTLNERELKIYNELPGFHKEKLINFDMIYGAWKIKTSLGMLSSDNEAIRFHAYRIYNYYYNIRFKTEKVMKIWDIDILAFPLCGFNLGWFSSEVVKLIECDAIEPCAWPNRVDNYIVNNDEEPTHRQKMQRFSALPEDEKYETKVHVNDLKRISASRGSHVIEMGADILEAYILETEKFNMECVLFDRFEPIEQPQQPIETEQKTLDWKESFFVDIAGKYAEELKDADEKYRKKFYVQPTREAFFSRMPIIRPEWVIRIDGKGEQRKWVFSDNETLTWTNYKRVFNRYFPELAQR